MTDTDTDLVEAKVHTMPECDFGEELETECDLQPERYDFKTQMGPWANGCTRHYHKYRLYLELGTGKGQKLVLS